MSTSIDRRDAVDEINRRFAGHIAPDNPDLGMRDAGTGCLAAVADPQAADYEAQTEAMHGDQWNNQGGDPGF